MSDDKKGMLRHVDVLGRVVIPREVRKALRINYGDLMEFCACSDKQVIMRKFHIIGEIVPLCTHLIQVARLALPCDIIIIDTEKVVAFNTDVNIQYGDILDDVRLKLESRKEQKLDNLVLTNKLTLDGTIIFLPVLCDGDILGGVIVRADVDDSRLNDIAKSISEFLSQYFRE